MYINFTCPPMPHLIVGGVSMFRRGDRHDRRVIYRTFDLIYVRSGKMYMEESGQKFELKVGQYLILPPNTSHSGYRYCDEDTVFSWVHFYSEGNFTYSEAPYPSIGPQMDKSKYYKKDPFYISLPQYGTVHPEKVRQMESYLDGISLVKIDHYQQTKKFYSSTISQIEYQIQFFKILTLICDDSEGLRPKDIAEEIYDYMNQYYKEPFNLTELAQEYVFHPSHIIRCVKRRYGFTPVQLLLKIRIEKAKNLLQNSSVPINTIAQSVGFSDGAYFSKQFKKIAGMTPLEYRMSLKDGGQNEKATNNYTK